MSYMNFAKYGLSIICTTSCVVLDNCVNHFVHTAKRFSKFCPVSQISAKIIMYIMKIHVIMLY